MIPLIRAMSVGNALQIFIKPDAGAEYWRLLRRATDTFTGPDDAGALVVHEGTDEVVMDATALVNDSDYYYHVYYWDGAAWSDGGGNAGTPTVTLEDVSADALTLLRDRLIAGLAVEIAAGRLRHPHSEIHCMNAPPRADDVVFPVVTVQLSQDAPAERVVGEAIAPDEPLDTGYQEFEGWYSRVQIEVVGWSFNPDERNELRKALKRIVIGNLPIFEAAGLRTIEMSQQDNEDYENFNATAYQTWGTFTCFAPSVVGGEADEITDVVTQITWG